MYSFNTQRPSLKKNPKILNNYLIFTDNDNDNDNYNDNGNDNDNDDVITGSWEQARSARCSRRDRLDREDGTQRSPGCHPMQ